MKGDVLIRPSVPSHGIQSEYRYHLGMVLAAVEQKERAKNEWESALRLRLVGDDTEEAKQVLAGN